MKFGCMFLIVGIIVGAIIGVLIHLINWYWLDIGFSSLVRTDYNFIMLALVFAVIGAIIWGIIGFIIGLLYAHFKKPEKE